MTPLTSGTVGRGNGRGAGWAWVAWATSLLHCINLSPLVFYHSYLLSTYKLSSNYHLPHILGSIQTSGRRATAAFLLPR